MTIIIQKMFFLLSDELEYHYILLIKCHDLFFFSLSRLGAEGKKRDLGNEVVFNTTREQIIHRLTKISED